jgi:hypothetical protein
VALVSKRALVFRHTHLAMGENRARRVLKIPKALGPAGPEVTRGDMKSLLFRASEMAKFVNEPRTRMSTLVHI